VRDERHYLTRNLIMYTDYGDKLLGSARTGFDAKTVDHRSSVLRK
jgi:hypothetical protein